MTEQRPQQEMSDRLRDLMLQAVQRITPETELIAVRDQLSGALARERRAVEVGTGLATYAHELEQELAALQDAMANDRQAWSDELTSVITDRTKAEARIADLEMEAERLRAELNDARDALVRARREAEMTPEIAVP